GQQSFEHVAFASVELGSHVGKMHEPGMQGLDSGGTGAQGSEQAVEAERGERRGARECQHAGVGHEAGGDQHPRSGSRAPFKFTVRLRYSPASTRWRALPTSRWKTKRRSALSSGSPKLYVRPP